MGLRFTCVAVNRPGSGVGAGVSSLERRGEKGEWASGGFVLGEKNGEFCDDDKNDVLNEIIDNGISFVVKLHYHLFPYF
jgi:hypothetical protein